MWILPAISKLIAIVLGFILIPLAVIFKAYKMTEERHKGHPKSTDGHKYNWTWKFMAPWDNHTDGIACYGERKVGPLWLQIIYWSAFRNPANGLRLMWPLAFVVKPEKVKFIGTERSLETYKNKTPHWFFCWHGLYSCYFVQFFISKKLYRIWIGWKILPQDSGGIENDDYRKLGSAFTSQFKSVD